MRAGRWVALGVLVVVSLVVSIPVVAHLSLSMRAERLAAVIASRRAVFLAHAEPARDGDQDCETSSVLAAVPALRRYEEGPRAALADAVDAALACRLAWNADPTHRWFAPRVSSTSVVGEYLALSRRAEPEVRMERAVRALRLADRLMSSESWHDCDAAVAGADALARVAYEVGPEARAAAIAQIEALALEPRSAWLVFEGTALAEAALLHEDVASRTAPRVFWHRSALRVALAEERQAYDVLALAQTTRGHIADAGLSQLAGKSRLRIGGCMAVVSAGRVAEVVAHVMCTRRAMRAALLVLDPARVSDPRLADPATGEPLRLSREASGAVSVTWGGGRELTTTIPSAPGEGEVDRMLRALARGDEDPPIAYSDED